MINVLSLGAGVQSTTLALMASHGEITPMPDFAVFADTGNEPKAVYDHLSWLMSPNVLKFPVHVVSLGNIADDVLNAVSGAEKRKGGSGKALHSPPFFIRGEKTDAMLFRTCTGHYKIDAVERCVLNHLGVKKGQRRPKEVAVTMWIGISLDEVIRAKPSRNPWSENRWPLLEKRIRRWDCLRWLETNDYPRPPKSACIMCPYRDNAGWRDMRDKSPAEFEQACQIDDAVRSKWPNTDGDVFIHRSMVPLRNVDLSNADERGQPDLFGNECEGMCGV